MDATTSISEGKTEKPKHINSSMLPATDVI
jgi:hypothetical protein